MPFVVVKVGSSFRVKNTKTGKVGSDVFKDKRNAEVQRKNRERFIKLISNKTNLKNPSKKK